MIEQKPEEPAGDKGVEMKKLKVLPTFMVIAFILMSSAPSFALDVGDKAPAFSGESTMGQIESTDYNGKKHVVLALYFAAFTPV